MTSGGGSSSDGDTGIGGAGARDARWDDSDEGCCASPPAALTPRGRPPPFPFPFRANLARLARNCRRSSATRLISAIPASLKRAACSQRSFGSSSRSEQLAARRLGAGERAAKNRRLGEVEQSDLSTRAVALLALGRRERRVQHVELGLSRSEGIAGPAANQRFHHTLVSALQVDPCAE